MVRKSAFTPISWSQKPIQARSRISAPGSARSASASTRSFPRVPSSVVSHARSVFLERRASHLSKVRTRPAIVRGYLFNDHNTAMQLVPFQRSDARCKFGSRYIPTVKIREKFNCSRDTVVHRMFVTLDNRSFMVYGYTEDGFPASATLAALKPSTKWCGEVAVFCVGRRATLLASPRVLRSCISRVASL
jgi:hypothetical protein